MKHLRIRILFFLFLTTCFVTVCGQESLPSPVISDKPAKLKLILKNLTHELWTEPYCDIYSAVNAFVLDRVKFDTKETLNDSSVVFKLEVKQGMTSIVKIKVDGVLTFFGASAVLVPGKETVVTFDYNTKNVAFKGPMSRLAEDNYKFLKTIKYKVSEIIGYSFDFQKSLERFDSLPPHKMTPVILKKFDQMNEMLQSDKEYSKDFKLLWRYYMAMNILDFCDNYLHRYNLVIWKNSLDKTILRRQIFSEILSHINPLQTNGVFYYMMNSNELTSFNVYMTSTVPSGSKTGKRYGKKNADFQALERALDMIRFTDYEVNRFWGGDKFTDANREKIRKIVPQYYNIIERINMEKRYEQEQERSKPIIGRICSLDLPSDTVDIKKHVLAKYRGKPTVLFVSDMAMLVDHTVRALHNLYGDKLNYVYLMPAYNPAKYEVVRRLLRMTPADIFLLNEKEWEPIEVYFKGYFELYDEHGKLLAYEPDCNSTAIPYVNISDHIPHKNLIIEGELEGLEKDTTIVLDLSSNGKYIDSYRISTKTVDKKFKFEVFIKKPVNLSLCFPNNSWAFTYCWAIPDSKFKIKADVNNYTFEFDNPTGYYRDWNDAKSANESMELSFSYRDSIDYDFNIRKEYLKSNAHKEGCIMYYVMHGTLPDKMILEYCSDSVRNGIFKEALDNVNNRMP